MASLIEALDRVAAQGWNKEWQHPAWKQFLLGGDANLLRFLPKFRQYSWLPNELMQALPGPAQIDAIGIRFLQACLATGLNQALGSWLFQSLPDTKAQQEQFAKACLIAEEAGFSKLLLAVQVTQYVRTLEDPNSGSPTAAGQFLLSLDDVTLGKLAEEVCQNENYATKLTAFYVAHAPERWGKMLDHLSESAVISKLDSCVWILPLAKDPTRFLKPATKAFEAAENWHLRFELGAALRQVNSEKFHVPMVHLCEEQLLGKDTIAKRRLWREAELAAKWLATNSGATAIPQLKCYFAAPLDENATSQTECKNAALGQAVQDMGRAAIPLFEACFETPQPEVQLQALKLWVPLSSADDATSLAAKFRLLLGSESLPVIARAARLAGDWNAEAVEHDLWPLLGHKSKPVRDAVAVALAKMGEIRLTKADELWAARRGETRIAAVNWLAAIGSPAAAAELSSRLEKEESDDVRDAILLALDKLSGGATNIKPAELEKRINKTIEKIQSPLVDWLDLERLPTARLKDGSPLSREWLAYLLFRQSRVKDMRADIEARPVYGLLDRQTTGDLALAVAQGFFASKVEADDRWAMAFAALLGNDRLVPVFTRQIKEWADNMRGKLAEYAVQALALLGTDAALLAVDALAIRYRSKNKNIGKAAAEAFAAAAEARGLTVEELGDLVVPWFGFHPGEIRTVDAGKTKIEVRISNEFKLLFRDASTGKKVPKLPDSVAEEIRSELKETSSGLKEAVKSQLLRMETLMVRQFRWPAVRWQELYLHHPLLMPFAQRLVWSIYDQEGRSTGTFRTLEDQTLTNAADEPVILSTDSHVGIVHPLELSPETRQAWLKHLADYDIVPPFAQLERPVVVVKPEQSGLKIGSEFADTELNGLTFKGRAERLGWARGSVCDAGCINFYLKRFPAAGVDVFLATEGMFVGIDMYTSITLGKMFFARHDSVQIGSYIYDEPNDEKDERLVPFGTVPLIAYSEAMGDIIRIAGKGKTTNEETTG